MGKGTAIFLTILFVVLAGGAVIGIDVYMSYKGFTDNPDGFAVSDPDFVLASNNESAVVSAVVSTPKLGYMPKSVRLDIEIYKYGNDTLYLADSLTIPLGENATIEFTVVFEQADVLLITGGTPIKFEVKGVAIPIYIGIPLNFLTMDIPTIEIEIP